MSEASREPFVTFELAIEPRGWERPGAMIRWVNAKATIHWFVRPEEEEYRKAIAWAAKAAMRSKPPTDQPVELLVQAFLPIPKSWAKIRKQHARDGLVLPTGKPDGDNIAKVIADSIIGIVVVDDAAVCDWRVTKRYADEPSLRVTVREIV